MFTYYLLNILYAVEQGSDGLHLLDDNEGKVTGRTYDLVKGYNEGSLNVVTILHTDRPSPCMVFTL